MHQRFEYAIQFSDGTYYTGRAGDGYKGSLQEAFTYTEQGAYRKVQAMRWAATVVHLL